MDDRAVVANSRVGLFDVPRRLEDFTLTRLLWRLTKGLLAGVAVLSLAVLDRTLLGGLLICGAGVSLARLAGSRSRSASIDLAHRPRVLVEAELDDARAELWERDGGPGWAVARTLPPIYFATGTAIMAGLLGQNLSRESPWPWLAATAFTALPAALHWRRLAWRLGRVLRLRRELRRGEAVPGSVLGDG